MPCTAGLVRPGRLPQQSMMLWWAACNGGSQSANSYHNRFWPQFSLGMARATAHPGGGWGQDSPQTSKGALGAALEAKGPKFLHWLP